jgi:hypothetical protein
MPRSSSPIPIVGEALTTGRDDVDRLLTTASREAARIQAGSAARAQDEARRHLTQIEEISAEIERQVETLEAAAARFAEVAAAASARLVELSEATDFSPPSFSGGLQGAVQEHRERVT